MKQKIKALSSLMDDECAVEQREALIEALRDDSRLQHRWRQYHMIRSVLRNDRSDYLYETDVASAALAIARRCQSEDRLGQDGFSDMWRQIKSGIAEWRQRASIWYGGAAVAATVAAVAFIAIPPTAELPGSAPASVPADLAAGPALFGQQAVDSTQWLSRSVLSSEQENLLSALVLSHNDYSVDGRPNHLRLVSYARNDTL